MKAKIILVLVVFVLLAVLLAQNTGLITYRLFFWTVSLSQVVIIPLVALAGFVLGFVTGAARRRMKGPKPRTASPNTSGLKSSAGSRPPTC